MKRFSLITIAAFFVLFLVSCQQNTEPNTSIGDPAYGAVYVPDLESLDCICDEANLHQKMRFHGKDNPFKKVALKGIERKLNLTEEQQTQVTDFLQEHRDCITLIVENLKAEQLSIIENANLERDAVLEQLANGEIDTATAKQMIMDINIAKRQTLQELRDNAKTAMEDCATILFENIESILTEEQLVIWQGWLDRFNTQHGRKRLH